MTTKLTLTIEEEVIRGAKSYAAKKGSSLSGIVENYLKSLQGEPAPRKKLSPKTAKLKGIISLPQDFDYRELLAKEITKKYGGK